MSELPGKPTMQAVARTAPPGGGGLSTPGGGKCLRNAQCYRHLASAPSPYSSQYVQ